MSISPQYPKWLVPSLLLVGVAETQEGNQVQGSSQAVPSSNSVHPAVCLSHPLLLQFPPCLLLFLGFRMFRSVCSQAGWVLSTHH